jgi:hypothetical protein
MLALLVYFFLHPGQVMCSTLPLRPPRLMAAVALVRQCGQLSTAHSLALLEDLVVGVEPLVAALAVVERPARAR